MEMKTTNRPNVYREGGAFCSRCNEGYSFEECVEIYRTNGRLVCPQCSRQLRTRPHDFNTGYSSNYFYEKAKRLGLL